MAVYTIAAGSVTAVLLGLWFSQPGWHGLELFALFVLASPLYAPLVYRLAVWIWVARRRRQLGLPAASDRDLIDYVGEELDRAAIEWQWVLDWRGRAREIEIDADEDLTVKVRHGVLLVSAAATGTTRFVDPVAAVDYAIGLYDGPARPDAAVFVEEA